MIPMFLFSGAFFPVANLDPALEALARLTPLWHGVDLTRMLTVGRLDPRPGAGARRLPRSRWRPSATSWCSRFLARRLAS